MPKILVADDDPHIRDVIRFALEREGMAVVEAEDGGAALALASSEQPDLIVLDIMMPELDGIEVCRRLRRLSAVPIVFLSSRDDEIDRVVGLELGGDDYVTKPFSPRELVARIKAVLRRFGAGAGAPGDQAVGTANVGEASSPTPQACERRDIPPPNPGDTGPEHVTRGRLYLNLAAYGVTWNGQEVALTRTEFALLRALAERPGRVLSRDALMDCAYALDHYVSDRTIDSHFRRVRAKFQAVGGAPVETVHGLGYKLGPC